MQKESTIDYQLLFCVIILVLIGTVMVYSASSILAQEKYGSSTHFLKKQIFRVGIGLIVLFIMAKIDYRAYRNLAIIGIVISIFLLSYILIASQIVKGAQRWLTFGNIPFQLQPSELAKFAIIYYFADALDRKRGKRDNFTDYLLPLLIIWIGISLLILKEPDFGTTVVISCLVFILFFAGRVKISHLAVLVIGTALVCFVVISNVAYVQERITSFLQQEHYTSQSNYQLTQSKIGLGIGGVWGEGLGMSNQKLLFLPEPFTDFIFSILGEELGFIGLFGVFSLFLVILWKGISIAKGAPDFFGYLLAVGLTFSIIVGAFINAAVVCGLLPTTGIPMPFISYGGSCLLFNMMGIGILLNISSQKVKKLNIVNSDGFFEKQNQRDPQKRKRKT